VSSPDDAASAAIAKTGEEVRAYLIYEECGCV